MGDTVGDAEQRGVDGHGWTWTPGRWWTSRRRSAWRIRLSVIVGQAQVVKSVTTSYAATVANGVIHEDHGYGGPRV
jgi:hypothetical protein